MGQLSSGGGIALVVPGYYFCAGILAFSALVAIAFGFYRGRMALYAAFAATCAASAGLSAALASYYLADSIGGAVEAVRWISAFAIVILHSLFVFVCLYTDFKGTVRWSLAALAVAAVFLAADFLLPMGARFSSVESFSWVYLPWGEAIFQLNATPGIWNQALRGVFLVFVIWSVARLLRMARQGQRRDAGLLALFIVMIFASSVQGALVDSGYLRTFHAIGFALLGFAVLMGLNLFIGMHQQNVALAAAAREDELTGLPNRKAVREKLGQLLEAGLGARHGAMLECDLDHFKVINDALGQEVGDSLLREVSRRLRDCAGDTGTAARMGGNDFVILVHPEFAAEAEARTAVEALARKVTAALHEPIHLGERSLTVAASLGLVTFETRRNSATEVIARADTAMELAKKRGRNTVQLFLPEMQVKAGERLHMVEGLRRAIERDELRLHFQPLVDADGHVLGAEALLRWQSAELGLVPPSAFIGVAEETGLIHSLGEWSLRTACERLSAWTRDGAGFSGYLSVNVSPWQLAHPDFLARLREIIGEYRVEPGRLTLEITESAVLVDTGEAVSKLREARPLGVRIALDDFGTGYSSLALIKDLPLDMIKIDQSFVRHLGEGANRHLVRMVVAIGGELGLGVLAEGVETRRDRDALVALGCRAFQGYYFARPMAEAEFRAWLAQDPVAPGGGATATPE